jgi:ribbon-helix-helix CopG family protein
MDVYMEVAVGLTKKTTILLQPELHRRLERLAEQRRTSMGELIRTACVRQYGLAGSRERTDAVAAMAELSLPVGSTGEMKRQSVPEAEDLMR